MDLKEQKEKVLQMLQEEKISQAEAIDLLELISEQIEKKEEMDEPFKNIKEKIVLSFPEIQEDFWSDDTETFEARADIDNNLIKELNLVGKNGDIEIRSHKSANIEIKGTFTTIRDSNPMITFDEKNGKYQLNYDLSAVSYMRLEVKIPEIKIKKLCLDTINGMISLKNVEAGKVKVTNRNGDIHLKELLMDSLEATTKNSPIILTNVEANKIELVTKNAGINVSNLACNFAEITTKNDEISIVDSLIKKGDFQTKNAPIWYDNSTNQTVKNYLVEAKTANADIVIILPKSNQLAYKLNAETKRGVIVPVGSDFLETVNTKDCLIGKTRLYEETNDRINMVLQTKNANIILKNK